VTSTRQVRGQRNRGIHRQTKIEEALTRAFIIGKSLSRHQDPELSRGVSRAHVLHMHCRLCPAYSAICTPVAPEGVRAHRMNATP
jgi:hypothetical protein